MVSIFCGRAFLRCLGYLFIFKDEALKSWLEVLSAWVGLSDAGFSVEWWLWVMFWAPDWICSLTLRGCPVSPGRNPPFFCLRVTHQAAGVLGVRLREMPGSHCSACDGPSTCLCICCPWLFYRLLGLTFPTGNLSLLLGGQRTDPPVIGWEQGAGDLTSQTSNSFSNCHLHLHLHFEKSGTSNSWVFSGIL